MCIKLCVFVFVSVLSIVTSDERYLEAPTQLSVSAVYPNALLVKWNGVAYKATDPVIGFKVKLWKVQVSTDNKKELVNGELNPGIVETHTPIEPFGNATIKSEPRVVVVNEIEEKRVLIDKIEYNVLYEVRVLAFKIDQDGPMTEPVRVKILDIDGHKYSVQREGNECFLSISSQKHANHEDYLYYHDSYF